MYTQSERLIRPRPPAATLTGEHAAWFASPGVGVVIGSGDARCLEVNDHMCRLLGYAREELVNRSWKAFTHPDDLELDSAHFARLVRGEVESYAIDKRFVRKDGSILWCLLSVSCVRAPDPAELRSVAFLTDITARKEAELALAEREAQMRAYFSSEGLGVVRVGADFRFKAANDEACRLFGRAREDLVGRTFVEVTYAEDQGVHREAVEAIIRGERTGAFFEKRYVRGDGSVLHALVSISGVRDAAIGFDGFVTMIQDIGAQKRVEDALRTALAENERLVAELRQAIDQVKTLEGFLPICSFCRKIRDDRGAWQSLEHYVAGHTTARFSHGLCPGCAAEHYGETDLESDS